MAKDGSIKEGKKGNCHPKKREVPAAQDLRHLKQNLNSTTTDIECFQALIDGESPAEDTMEHNYLLGDQLLYLQGQYERLLRKQVSQASYKLEFLLSKLQTIETNEQFKDRRHSSLLKSVKNYNSYHLVEVIDGGYSNYKIPDGNGPDVHKGVNQTIL